MELDIQKEGSRVIVKIVGAVDTEGGRELSDTVTAVIEDGSLTEAVFDLSEVPAITSAGIGKLLRFFKHFDKIDGSMKIKGISAPLKEQFLEIHLEQIIPIED